ncbi:hypothetical protein, partial [Tritonibacter sp. SIMBA_163]|uniref:hypothetical protein n=1 Tax=Tritonibacter sp. SIMBA_163 TaxID=3080868 RepID=UPI003980DB7C
GGLLGLIFAGLAVGKVFQTACAARASRLEKKNRRLPATITRSFGSPVSLLALTMGLTFGLSLIELDPRLAGFGQKVLTLLYIAAAGWL